MVLRFVLVGLVASMGFEMPSTQDLASWTRSGRDWCDARLADVSCLKVEAAKAFAGVADCERVEDPAPLKIAEVAPSLADLTFDAVVDGMAKDFSADLASIEADMPVEVEEAIAVVEPFKEMLPAAPSESQIAVEPVEKVAEARPEPIVEPTTIPPPGPAAEDESRVAKISSAVRLTRQALSAWAALIQSSPSPDQPAGDDQDDSL